MAVYTDDALNRGERDWMITGVSLRSAGVADQLNPQDGLYLVNVRSASADELRLIGSVAQVIVAAQSPEAVVAAIAAPSTHILSFTVTEKGYCRAADGALDPQSAGRSSIYTFLRDGLAARRDSGLPGVTLLSCDNLSDNGRQLEKLLLDFLERDDPSLKRWVFENCTFPCSMVDRIVPATTADNLNQTAKLLGLDDAGLVLTEPFTQWVIEDRFAGPRPRWERSGVQFVPDVAAWEKAKLRMLNGSHSALAYLGLRRGYTFVHEAIKDVHLCQLAKQLMCEEAASTLPAIPNFNPHDYASALIERFRNPALQHRLEQIAMDGSQKVPQRWLETLCERNSQGLTSPVIIEALAAWVQHLSGQYGAVDDPVVMKLKLSADTQERAQQLFGASGFMPLPEITLTAILELLS